MTRGSLIFQILLETTRSRGPFSNQEKEIEEILRQLIQTNPRLNLEEELPEESLDPLTRDLCPGWSNGKTAGFLMTLARDFGGLVNG